MLRRAERRLIQIVRLTPVLTRTELTTLGLTVDRLLESFEILLLTDFALLLGLLSRKLLALLLLLDSLLLLLTFQLVLIYDLFEIMFISCLPVVAVVFAMIPVGPSLFVESTEIA